MKNNHQLFIIVILITLNILTLAQISSPQALSFIGNNRTSPLYAGVNLALTTVSYHTNLAYFFRKHQSPQLISNTALFIKLLKQCATFSSLFTISYTVSAPIPSWIIFYGSTLPPLVRHLSLETFKPADIDRSIS